MPAGYRDFRPRDEDPNDHAAVAAVQARSEAVKADEAFREFEALRERSRMHALAGGRRRLKNDG